MPRVLPNSESAQHTSSCLILHRALEASLVEDAVAAGAAADHVIPAHVVRLAAAAAPAQERRWVAEEGEPRMGKFKFRVTLTLAKLDARYADDAA